MSTHKEVQGGEQVGLQLFVAGELSSPLRAAWARLCLQKAGCSISCRRASVETGRETQRTTHSANSKGFSADHSLAPRSAALEMRSCLWRCNSLPFVVSLHTVAGLVLSELPESQPRGRLVLLSHVSDLGFLVSFSNTLTLH